MAVAKPVKVPQQKVTSLDIVSFDGGLDQRGDANIRSNSFTVGRNVMVNGQGLATHRYVLRRWLPQTVGNAYQVSTNLWNGQLYNFVADDGKIKWCKDTDSTWTDCAMDGSATAIDMTAPTMFLRVEDNLLILNGVNELQFVKLSEKKVYGYVPLADPATALTFTRAGLTTGSVKLYYAISYNSTVGETEASPVLTADVNKQRDQWKGDGTESITITDPNTRPAGATSWNVYIALAMPGGIVQKDNLLPLVHGLDIGTTTFTDNGSLAIGISTGVAPTSNGTAGPKAKYGVEIEGRPFLFGITGKPYSIRIGGNAGHAMDFSPGNGGYELILNEGTNYYPTSVVGFRNGQGLPAITVLFSNTQGLSKQSIIEQNTVSVGDTSIVVWGQTEQNYGTAGVGSPYGVVNYQGGLHFPSTDGIVRADTQASLQNVLSFKRISDPILDDVNSIHADRLKQIVGTAWDNRVYFSAPTRGFTENNKLLVYDTSRKDAECWYIYDIASQWVGVVTPDGSPSFVYVCQGNNIFKLVEGYVAQDETPEGLMQAFPFELTTALISANTPHNSFFAVVQAVFYLTNFIGTADLSLRYRDYQSGRFITRTKTVSTGDFEKSSSGGWGDASYLYETDLPTTYIEWDDIAPITDTDNALKQSLRVRMQLDNVVTNEMQASVKMNLDNSAVVVRSISMEGLSLGVAPDIT